MAIEISGQTLPIKSARVKLLGCLGVNPEGSDVIRWIMICVLSDDPMSDNLNGVTDVETWMPGRLEQIRDFFRELPFEEEKTKNALFDGGRFQELVSRCDGCDDVSDVSDVM